MEDNENEVEDYDEETLTERIIRKTEDLIEVITKDELEVANIDLLYKLVDIHKDMKNEEYWKGRLNCMYRRGYGDDYDYGYGNYNEGRGSRNKGNYRARGYDTRYRTNGIIDDMNNSYQAYQEGKMEYETRGNYGAKEDSMKSLEYMLRLDEKFIDMLEEEAQSQEEIDLIKEHRRKMADKM